MIQAKIQVGDADRTVELLWERVRQRGDLPGFSKVVNAIVGAMRGDDAREFNMTKTVLSDPALTQKVLRLANSAMYSVFGQGINTVSKAVMVLGTESIGHLALGLKLIDGMSGVSGQSAGARDEMERAVLAGHIARQVASAASMRDAEEAVVCSMLHSLGRMMLSFYLPELWEQVSNRCAGGMEETDAARAVFGLGLDEVGRLIAKQWGFPAGLIDSMQDVLPQAVAEPLPHRDWIAALSTMSSRCAGALSGDGSESAVGAAITGIAGSYADMLGLEMSQVLSAVDTAHKTAQEEAAILRPAKPGENAKRRAEMPPAGKPADAAAILARGVADMREAAQKSSYSQLLTMALETVYQGLGFSRAIAFMRNHETAQYTARMCFGEGLQELAPRLQFDDAYQPDVFHAALANDKMVFVENAEDPRFLNKLPRWWCDALPTARSFMVLPITVNRHSLGFIYGDWDRSLPLSKIVASEIAPLNELRLLVVEAVEQRRKTDRWGA